MTYDPKVGWTASEATRASGSLAALGAELAVRLLGTDEELHITLAGTFTGTIQLLVSTDGTNYLPAPLVPLAGGAAVVNLTAAGTWVLTPVRGVAAKAKATAWTSGSATVTLSVVSRA